MKSLLGSIASASELCSQGKAVIRSSSIEEDLWRTSGGCESHSMNCCGIHEQNQRRSEQRSKRTRSREIEDEVAVEEVRLPSVLMTTSIAKESLLVMKCWRWVYSRSVSEDEDSILVEIAIDSSTSGFARWLEMNDEEESLSSMTFAIGWFDQVTG